MCMFKRIPLLLLTFRNQKKCKQIYNKRGIMKHRPDFKEKLSAGNEEVHRRLDR
ncbi:hypothetical protein BDFB_007600 [Asbolus verrucosus]|uniref:Uncharacterized protein n=1 Tax=Asbolus verrucosus TaxID=1661398 RepID=A0A482VCZ2_ASBVE|nr:hypothetical protein BDFB_007600 [Asbolus verrucosus]